MQRRKSSRLKDSEVKQAAETAALESKQQRSRHRPKTVVTFFAQAGVDWESVVTDLELSQLQLHDPDVRLPACLTDRFPPEDYEDADLDSGSAAFCFPVGVRTSLDPPKTQFHCFTITGTTAINMYAGCLTFSERVDPDGVASLAPGTLGQCLRSNSLAASFADYLSRLEDAESSVLRLQYVREVNVVAHELPVERRAAAAEQLFHSYLSTDSAQERAFVGRRGPAASGSDASETNEAGTAECCELRSADAARAAFAAAVASGSESGAEEDQESVASGSVASQSADGGSIRECEPPLLAALRETQQEVLGLLGPHFETWRAALCSRPLYAQRCCFVTSPWPMFRLFEQLLFELHELAVRRVATPVPLERSVMHVVKEVPEPPPGKPVVTFGMESHLLR